MKCKLTGVEGKPVEAHIIPRSFYEINLNADGPHRIISNKDGVYSRRVPIGIYDTTIVTEEGERLFSPWDDYAAELLIEQRDKLTPLQNGSTTIGYRRENYNYKLLKLFALSLVWRASVSSQPYFAKVRLEHHEAKIRHHLLSCDPGGPNCYSVILGTWSDQKSGSGMMDPFRERYDHVNFYRIYVGNYILYVKIDQRDTPRTLRDVQLDPKRPLVIIARELAKSKELPIMKSIIIENSH